MKRKNISADERDRREEAEQDRYEELFALHSERLARQYREEGGSGNYSPPYQEVHKAVTQQMDLDHKQTEQDCV